MGKVTDHLWSFDEFYWTVKQYVKMAVGVALMFHYRLRTLLVVLAIGPFLLAWLWVNREGILPSLMFVGPFLVGCAFTALMLAILAWSARNISP